MINTILQQMHSLYITCLVIPKFHSSFKCHILLATVMAKKSKDQGRVRFKDVQLFKDQSLGIGSYGALCKAKYGDI